MQGFQKNKLFYILLIFLSVGILSGVVCCYFAYDRKNTTEKKLTLSLVNYRALLVGHKISADTPLVSLTSTNVGISEKDSLAMIQQRDDLRAAISGAPNNQFIGKANLTPADLASTIKQTVDELQKYATDKDIRFLPGDNKCEFGFRRYIRNAGTSPKGANLTKVEQQIQIIEFLYKTLAESRPTTPAIRQPILVQSIDREPLETFEIIPAGKPNAGAFGPVDGARNEPDEFTPSRTFRNPPLIEGLSFRLRFCTTTPVLRAFINKVRNSGRPFVITSIEINNPAPENLKLMGVNNIINTNATNSPLDFTGSVLDNSSPVNSNSPAVAPKEERKVVIRQNFSEITLQLDYLSAPEDKPISEAEPKK